MKQTLLVLLLSTLLILHANCSNLRKLEETQPELPQQESQSQENNQEQQDSISNEQEQQVDQYDESDNGNGENNEPSQEENNQNEEEIKNNLVAQRIFELIQEGLQLNEDRNDLLKVIHQISIKSYVEEPSSLTNENVTELRNRLQENQEAIEELKNVNEKLEDIQQQLFSLII